MIPLLILCAALLSRARAAELEPDDDGVAPPEGAQVVLGAAPSLSLLDEFVRRRGAEVAVELRPVPQFGLLMSAAWYPDLGERDYTRVSRQLIEKNNVSPDISRLMSTAGLRFAYYPLQVELARRGGNFGFYGGFGAATTVDDLESLQADADDPVYVGTANQTHTTILTGIRGDVRSGTTGFYVDLGRIRYVEVVGGTTLETQATLMLAMGLTLHIPPTR